jgi:hypothetical protein
MIPWICICKHISLEGSLRDLQECSILCDCSSIIGGSKTSDLLSALPNVVCPLYQGLPSYLQPADGAFYVEAHLKSPQRPQTGINPEIPSRYCGDFAIIFIVFLILSG